MNPNHRYDPATHSYWMDGVRVPGTTSLTDQLDASLSRIDPEVLQRKADIGTAVHFASTLIDDGILDDDSVDDACAGYLDAYRLFVQQNKPRWLLTETWRCHPRWRYGGQLDRFGIIGGEYALVDLKCVSVLHPKVGPQTAAYKELILVDDPTLLITRYALLLKPNGRYVYEAYRDADDWLCFCSLLQQHHWKNKRGLIQYR